MGNDEVDHSDGARVDAAVAREREALVQMCRDLATEAQRDDESLGRRTAYRETVERVAVRLITAVLARGAR